MKAFVSAVVAALVIAVGASFLLSTQQTSVSTAFATSSVRVGDPGNNLIGVN